MIRFGLTGILMVCGLHMQAQYYLQHLVIAERSADQFKLLKKYNVRKVTASSTEADGTTSDNFLLEQQVDAGRNMVITNTNSDFTGRSVMTSTYNNRGQVLQVVDSSSSIVTRSNYEYNEKGQLVRLKVESADSMQQYTVQELHAFEYDTKGFPSGMVRIKNLKDTTRAVFIASENGKPGEEHWWRNNRRVETWYYYYDEKGQLTDVARFNARANRVLPDYVYEYDANGRVIKQTTVQAASNYRVWQFQYDNRGLKSKEMVFDKNRKLEGTINYSYQ